MYSLRNNKRTQIFGSQTMGTAMYTITNKLINSNRYWLGRNKLTMESLILAQDER
jgi:hypothetical protein